MGGVLDGADALVNLSGESIGDKRWTPQRKKELRESRILPTRSLAAAIAGAAIPPAVFVSSSAVGYYGPSGDDRKTEDSPAGQDFLAELCVEWEEEAQQSRAPGHAPRAPACGSRPRAIGRRASSHDGTVPVLRRRPDWIGPPVHVMDSPAGLGRDGPVDCADAGGHGADECDGAASRHQPSVRQDARFSTAETGARPGADVRHQAAPRRVRRVDLSPDSA